MDKTVKVELQVSSKRLKLKDISGFEVGLKITNSSSCNLHFDLSETRLTMNDKRVIAWDLAVQNGTLVNLKILPNHSKTIKWPLGEAMFETSGTYELELYIESSIQKQTVVVLNNETFSDE